MTNCVAGVTWPIPASISSRDDTMSTMLKIATSASTPAMTQRPAAAGRAATNVS